MTHPTRDLDLLLKEMDPADEGPCTLRVEDLDRILSTERTPAASGATPMRRRSKSRRHTLIAGLAATAVAAALLTPWPGQDDAFADWTARPAGVPAEDMAALAQQCRDLMVDPEGQTPDAVTAFVPVEELVPVLAEQRGKYTLTVMEGRGNLGHCLTTENEGGSAGMATAVDTTLRPEPGELSLLDFSGSTMGGPDPDKVEMNPATIVMGGRVGPDVTAVTIHPPGQVPVQATVESGYWTAWWPFELISTKMPTPIGTTAELTITDGSIVDGIDITSIVNFDYN